MSVLSKILINYENVDGILCKILTKNDDSGRHGVLIPVEAYRLFPAITNFIPNVSINYTEQISYLWNDTGTIEVKDGNYKHYHRYPERRITRLKTSVNSVPEHTLIIVGRRKDYKRTYEIHILEPDHIYYSELLSELNLSNLQGSFFLDLDWHLSIQPVQRNNGIDILLEEFDKIKEMGYVKTLRSGSTGVGYTFESLMGIEENNSSGPDFKGIELKCFRLKQNQSKEKMNLFLKEPEWIDGSKNQNERLERYGYFDAENQRQALYSTPTININTHNLSLSVDNETENVYLCFNNTPIGKYDFTTIQFRLNEKLTESAYIGAENRGKDKNEEFHYVELTYYSGPSIKEFIQLIESGDVMMEIRMHTKRNHGTCFRVKEEKLIQLYSRTERLRDRKQK